MIGKPPLPACFPEEAPRALYGLKEDHFWFSHRRTAILEAVRKCLPEGRDARVLDFGCGDGEILAPLSLRFLAVGIDRRVGDLLLARRRGARRLVAGEGGSDIPLRRRFDLVGLFDVVEHVEDDAGFLRAAAALAVSGGFVLITVPADPRLWGKFDRYAGHYRRYTRSALTDLVQEAGLEVLRILPLFRTLWPLARIGAILQRNGRVSDPAREYRVARPWNELLRRILSVEHRLFGASERGIGTSWLAVSRSPDKSN